MATFHGRRRAGNHNPYACTFESCEYRATNNCKLQLHIRARHTPGKARNFQCPLCPSRFCSYFDLSRHISRHTKENRFTCEVCKFSSHDRTCLRRHMGALHRKSVHFNCSFPGCNYSTFCQSYLNNHRKTHDPDPKVRCPFPCDFPNCDFRTNTKESLRRHKNARHNGNRTKNFPCPLCTKWFHRRPDVQDHIKRVHIKEETFICDQQQCNYKTHYSSTLQRHRQVKHGMGKVREKKFECDSCDYRASCGFHFDLHKRKKHGVEPRFKCDFAGCDYETDLHLYAFKNHQLTHENDPQKQYPFLCKFFPSCDFRRRLKCQIREHERKHHASKLQFQCQFCTNCYPDSLSFNFHNEMTHSKKSYKCSKCEYVTCFKRNIGRHVRISHKSCLRPHESPRTTTCVRRLPCSINHKIPVVILGKIHVEIL